MTKVPTHYGAEVAALDVLIADRYGRESEIFENVPITPVVTASTIAKRYADFTRESLEYVIEPESATDTVRDVLNQIFGAHIHVPTARDACVSLLHDTPPGEFPVVFARACRDLDATFRGTLDPVWSGAIMILSSLSRTTSRDVQGARVMESSASWGYWTGLREIADALDRAELYRLIPDKGWDDFKIELARSWHNVKEIGKDAAETIGEAAAGAAKYASEVAGSAAHGFLTELGVKWIVIGAAAIYAMSRFGVI